MFGLGKRKLPTGAREKLESAKKMRAAGHYNLNDKHRGGGGDGGEARYPSQTIAITLVYAVATILAMVITGGGSNNPMSGMQLTGISSIDNFVTGSDITTFMGDPDEDKVITILLRGLAYFALAGLVPLITFGLERLVFRKIVMPLVLCWGVIITLMVFYLCIPPDSIMPFFKGIIPFIKSL